MKAKLTMWYCQSGHTNTNKELGLYNVRPLMIAGLTVNHNCS